MLKKVFLPILLVFFTFSLHAQKDVELVNSGQVLFNGNLYYYMGYFQKAADEFRKVGRNDTNYAQVLCNLAQVYSDDHEDSLCAVSCKAGIQLGSNYTCDFYEYLGISLKEMGKYDSALHVLDRAIAKYPYDYRLFYQEGMVYFKMKKYPEAEKWFQKTLELNPYHASSHFQLGKMCAEQGRLVPAMLSYQFYLMLDPSTQSDRAKKVVSQLEDLTTGDYQPDPDLKLSMTEAGDDCFADINDAISAGKAYASSYKNLTKINLKLVKQLQMMMEKLRYKEGTGNWYMEHYVSFYNGIWDKKHFVPFISYALASVSDNNATVLKSIKKNKKKITAFAKWAGDYLDEHLQHPAKELAGLKMSDKADYIFYDDHFIAAIGTRDANDKQVGTWTYFYERSGELLASGNFNAMGKKDGDWRYFWSNGKVKSVVHYTNDLLDGPAEEYGENGLLNFKGSYVKGELDGPYESYAVHGGLKEKAAMKNGELDGPASTYYSNGSPRLEMNYKLGKLDGVYKGYSLNGKVIQEYIYVNGKLNGHAKEYYGDGTVQSEGDYKNDKPVGEWKYFYANGKVKREGMYKETGREGVWKEYYSNGQESADAHYKSGDLDGELRQFDIDGVIYEVDNYTAGKLVTMKFFDKKGSAIASYNMKGDVFVTEYFPDGTRHAEGHYYNGKRDGDWKIYANSGGYLYAKQHYNDGYLDGERTEFYANGKKAVEESYSWDTRDGYYKSYFMNGNMQSEGWLVRGNREGDWYYYNERGIVTAHKYYINDAEHGYQDFFDQLGRRDETDFVKEAFLWSRIRVDSAGTEICHWDSDNGTGTYVFKYPNGKSFVEVAYKNGYREGITHKYDWDGTVLLESNYVNGSQYGLRKENYAITHKPYYESTYDYDDLTGTSTAWWENGNKRWEEIYMDGDQNGLQKYYWENGALKKESTRIDGNLEGEYKAYSDDGSLQYVAYYHNGSITGYSYLDKEGKLVPTIKIENGTGDFCAYYQNGDTSLCSRYENGAPHGRAREYYPNGQLSEDENYDHGYYSGVQRYYYNNGMLRKELNYFADMEDGPQKYYYENGKIEHTETYVLGDAFGNWHYYDQSGIEMTVRTFYDDMQISETQAAAIPQPSNEVPKKPKGK